MEKKNIYQKIQSCRAGIKASDLKKAGYNDFSGYPYYTPEQVDKLVNEACLTEKLFHKFELKRDQNGLYGEMTIIDLESGEDISFIAATEMPKITATNASQQMGGCMTFAERYLKQTIFNIVDNNLDFDAQKPTSPKIDSKGATSPKKNEPTKPWLNKGTKEFEQAAQAIIKGKRKAKDVRKAYAVNKAVFAELEALERPF